MDNGTTRTEFSRLVNQHSKVLLRFAVRRLDNQEDCEDVVAETFLIVWRRWEDLPTPDDELAWLYGIAFRVLSNRRRARDRRERLRKRLTFERESEPQGSDPDRVDVRPILRALGQLRRDERQLLEFVYWEELSYRDIALVLEVSENAVGIRINRAKGRLRSLLQSPQSDESQRGG